MRKYLIVQPYLLLALVVSLALVLFAVPAPAASAATEAEPPLTIVKPLTITPLNPMAGKVVTAEFSIRNDGAEAVFLYQLGAAGRAPGCTDFSCSAVENFEIFKDVTIGPGETFDYKQQRIFLEEGVHFFQLTYEAIPREWRFIGDRVEVDVQPGLRLTQPLVLNPSAPAKDADVLATFELANAGTEPLSLARLVVGARGPDCVPADWSCTARPDHPAVDNLTLAPGEAYQYSATRAYADNGRYFVQVSFIGEAGVWEQIGERIQFLVSDIGGVGTENLYLPLVNR
jgi:hypothetical protein